MACRLLVFGPEVLTPSQKHRVLHLALAGSVVEPLRLLLEDVLADSGVRYDLTSPPGACDVVLVMVSWGDGIQVIEQARALAGDVPLLAILPFGDEALEQRVLQGGAQGWFSLDTPLALLLAALFKLAAPGPPIDEEAA